jgi:hypothetical protein
VVDEAKAKTNNGAWLRALDKATAGLLDGSICVTLFADGYALVTTPTGQHRVNGRCACKAAQFGNEKRYHRVAKKIWENYEAAVLAAPLPEAVSFADDVATSPRSNLIAEIKNIWPRFAPGLPLATELMARFSKNKLEMLDDDLLRRVRLAVAM